MPVSDRPLGVYVHIPFCTTACPYCNFNFRLRRNFSAAFVEEYVQALLIEWEPWRKQGRKLASLYFGGGTPSLLSPEQIAVLVEKIAGNATKIEVTLEANPEDFAQDPQRLHGFRQAGINRLSLGVQSFQPQMLQRLGRGHQPQDVRRVIETARKLSFENISCDLMGALPQQDLAMLQADVDEMLQLPIEHISYYGLTIEEKTAFHQQSREGKLICPDEEVQAEMFSRVEQVLEKSGFGHYEISNYAQAGFESQHNLGYWNFQDYAGLGAGAHSFERKTDRSVRSMNLEEPRAYVTEISQKGRAQKMSEEVSGKKAMGEFMFTGLRQLRGFPVNRFRQIFGETLEDFYAKELNALVAEGLLELQGSGAERIIKLTARGVLLSDSVFEAFL